MNTNFQTKHQLYYDFYKIDLNNPQPKLRDDIRFIPLALEHGWKVIEGRHFGDCNRFGKGNKEVWFCRRGWAVADIIDGYYSNHRYYDTIYKALITEG